jgi:hypothetical protein
MRGVIDIDEAAQVTIVVDERALGKRRSLIPEDVNVTETVLRPDIELGAVPWRGLQRLPLALVKHGFTSSLIRQCSRMPTSMSTGPDGLGQVA